MSIWSRYERESFILLSFSPPTPKIKNWQNRDESCLRITRHSYSSKHQRATEGCRQRTQKRGPPRYGPGSWVPPAPLLAVSLRTSSVASREGCCAPEDSPPAENLRPMSYVIHSASCAPSKLGEGRPHLITAHAFAPSIKSHGKITRIFWRATRNSEILSV